MVYVDDMKACYGRLVMCHMMAGTDEELRDMVKIRQQKRGVA